MPLPTARRTACLTVPTLLLVCATVAQAVPRYTAVYGQNCVLCHVNPTGGGMRSLYASQFLVPEEIAASGWRPEEMQTLSPQISPNLAVGLDLRTLVWQREGGDGTTLSMQGDLYVDARLGRSFSAYLEQSQGGAGEIFGAIHALPLDGYLKAGRFMPDYGWRFADHQMFNRRYLLDPGGTENPAVFYGSGLEAGVSPGPLAVTGSLLGETEQQGDAYAVRGLLHHAVGPVNLGAGASLLRRDRAGDHRRSVGGFWYVSAGPLTWLGEIDETKQEGRLGNLVAHEWTVNLRRGLDLRGTYSFQDPDRHRKNGLRQRYGVGAVWLPYPFFGLQGMVNRWKIDPGELVDGSSAIEGELVVHFFY